MAVDPDPDPVERELWEHFGVHVVEQRPTEFLDELDGQARPARGRPRGAVSPPDGPYVGLDCFHEEDAGLFFGRDAERTRIIGNLRASRLTLLHAESGVGKSSLLRAGVSARLNEPAANVRGGGRYVTVVFNGWGPSPTAALIESLASAARATGGGEGGGATARRPGARDRGRVRRDRRDRARHPRSVRGALPVRVDGGRRLRRRARGMHRRPHGAGALPHLRARGRLRAHRGAVQEPHPERLRQLPASRLPRRGRRARGRSSSPWPRSTGASPRTRPDGTSSPRWSTPCSTRSGAGASRSARTRRRKRHPPTACASRPPICSS